jgi:ABC-2 type transport system ATP-binding protein
VLAGGRDVADIHGPAIETQGLTRAFGGKNVVDGLDLAVTRGEIFGLLGPNGAGKTTTIRMITTLLASTAGIARVCGFDVARQAGEVRKRVGYVMQDIPRGLYALTARERVEMEAALYHVPRSLIRTRADEVLGAVGLLQDAGRPFMQFSGGMQKRLDIACGMLHQPEVLILDEPTLGLDVASRHGMWEHVRTLQGRGVTVLLATNYLDEADRLCDRLTIIDKGRAVITGDPATLKRGVGADVVEITTAQVQPLAAAISGSPFVSRTFWPGGDTLTVYVTDAAAAIPAVMRIAQDAGVHLDRVTYNQPTLDDVFLLHTGHGLQEGEAA